MLFGSCNTGRHFSTIPAPKVSILPYVILVICSFPVSLWSILWCAHIKITFVQDGNVEGVQVLGYQMRRNLLCNVLAESLLSCHDPIF